MTSRRRGFRALRTCVFEDDPGGHRLAHVEMLLRHLFRVTGVKPLLVTTRELLQSVQYQVNLKKNEKFFDSWVFSEKSPSNRVVRWRQFSRAVHQLEAQGMDRVLVPTSDQLVQMIGLGRLLGFRGFSAQVRCGILRLDAAYPGFSFLRRVKNRFSFWLQRQADVQGLYYDAYAVREIRRQQGWRLRGIQDPPLVPGPAARSFVSHKSKKNKKGICFGCIGSLDSRKGTDLLLEAFQRARLPADSKLLVAGEVLAPGLLDKIREAQVRLGAHRLMLHNEFLDNTAYWRRLKQMDVVCLPYRSHVGASGVFAQAALSGKAVVASDYGWLGGEGKKYNKMVLFKNLSVDSLKAALERVAADPNGFLRRKPNYRPVDQVKYLKDFCGI